MAFETITVRTSTELEEAVERLAAGDGGVVVMEAGRYHLNLRDPSYSQLDAPVRMTSADPADPATFTKLALNGRENVSIDHVVFDSTGTETTTHHRDLDIAGSEDISIRDSVFRGGATESLDGTAGQVRGVNLALIRDSSGIELSDNVMSGYYHGVAFKDSSDVVFAGNELTRFQGDGIRIAGVQDLLIEGNHLHSMLGSSQDINHSDMIQFWGTNIAQNTMRVTIRENVINTSDGPAYQMIFGRNEHHDRNGWLFQDIVIEENLLYGAHHNTISIAETDGMIVRHNTVLWNRDTHALLPGGEQGSSVNGWVRAPGSGNAVIENNLATNISGGSGANGIVTYGDATDAGHFSRHFVNLDAGGSAELRDLTLRSDSAWDGVLGARMTWSSHAVDGLTATASLGRVVGDRSAAVLDARFTRDAAGTVGADDARFTWLFEDGTRKEGLVVEHDFVTPGRHGYALEVRTTDGRTDRIERTVTVEDPDLLAIDMTDGRLRDTSDYGTSLAARGGAFEDGGFRLDGSSRIDISRGAEHMFSLDSFAISMRFAPDAGTSGTLLELKSSMEASVTDDGRLVFEITTTTGSFRVATEAGALSGTEPRDIGIIMDGAMGELRLVIDGEVAGTAAVSGLTRPLESWGFAIGNVFGGSSVKGVVSDIAMRAEPALESEAAPAPAPEPLGPEEDPRAEALIAHFDFDDGVADASGAGTRVQWNEAAARFGEGSDGQGASIALGDRDDGVTLARSNAHLFDLDAFHVSFDFRRADLDQGGQILSLHKALDLSVDAEGALSFELTTVDGAAVAQSWAPVIADTGWHSVELAYDAAAGLMQLVVDGEVVGDARQTGATQPAYHWGLTLGRRWGGEADGYLDDLRIFDEAHLRSGGMAHARGEGGELRASPTAGCDDPSDGTLAKFDFERGLAEAGGRKVGVWKTGDLGFAAGRDGGTALRVEQDAAMVVARDNAFLHERDAFAFAFDLKRDGDDDGGRVLHMHKAMEACVEDDEFVFGLTTDEGHFRVSTKGDALAGDGWHQVEIGYDDARDRLSLTVDGETTWARASGTTAPGSTWGLSLGSTWGDSVEGAIDDFAMAAAPDWALS